METKSVILIPALNPPATLINYIEKLCDIGFEYIIVINDGSSREYDLLFEK